VRKIGIVGGIAWPSTADYYSQLCRRGEARHLAANRPGPPATPEMSIESLDLNRAASFLGIAEDEVSWSRFDDYHRCALLRLQTSGAGLALLASNTAHHRFDSIVRGVGIPVVHIWEEAAKECARQGARQVLVLGTRVTVNSAELRKRFAEHGVEAAGPGDESAAFRTEEVIAALQAGNTGNAAERIEEIAKTQFSRRFPGRPAVCLACTELPLAFTEQKALRSFTDRGVSYVNSPAVHIGAAFDLASAD
jgi:aspartate racemase